MPPTFDLLSESGPACCRSLSTVRVMVITRSAFESIERNFPIASRLVLENLKRRSEAQVTGGSWVRLICCRLMLDNTA